MKYLFIILLTVSTLSAQSLKELYKRGYITVQNDLTITDERQNEIFAFFAPLGVDENENIFVKDNKKICFLKFDKNGKFISKISNKGKGPGEISVYGIFEIDRLGNLLVQDFGNARMSILDNNGKFKNSFKAVAGKYVAQYKLLTNGNYILELSYSSGALNKSSEETKKIEVFSPTMKPLFTLASKKLKGNQKINVEGMVFVIGNGFNEKFFWDLLPNGNVVTASSGENQISVFSPKGKLIKQFNSNAEQRAITEKDKEMQRKTYKADKSDAGVEMVGGKKINLTITEERVDKLREKVEFPSKTPFFSKLLLDDEGNILLKSYMGDEKNDIWIVHSMEGDFIGKVRIPNKITGFIKKGKIYQIEETDEGKEIKRYIIK